MTASLAYLDYALSDLKLGPYRIEDRYYDDWYDNLEAEPVDDKANHGVNKAARQQQFTQQVYKTAQVSTPKRPISTTIVTIPAHLDLLGPDIDLTDPSAPSPGFTVVKVTENSLQLKTTDRQVGQFLLKLSQYGQELLNREKVSYGYYENFALATATGSMTVIRCYVNDRLSQALSKRINETITNVVIRPRAIWRYFVNCHNQDPQTYSLKMLVSLVSYRAQYYRLTRDLNVVFNQGN